VAEADARCPPRAWASTVATAEAAARAKNGTFSARSLGAETEVHRRRGQKSRARSTSGSATSVGLDIRPRAMDSSAAA
jgi:hypothetical protein